MSSPNRLVNITRSIHRTLLSMPRDLASRATQTSNAMFSTKIMMGSTMKKPPHPAQLAQAAASEGGGALPRLCAKASAPQKNNSALTAHAPALLR
jgi:hypothetical protein